MREDTQQVAKSTMQLANTIQQEILKTSGEIVEAMERAESEGAMLRQAEGSLEKWKREQYVEQLTLLRAKSDGAVMTASNEKDRQAQFEVWFNSLSQTQEMQKYQREMEAGLDSAKLTLEQKKRTFDALRIQADLQAAKLGLLAQIVAAEENAANIQKFKIS